MRVWTLAISLGLLAGCSDHRLHPTINVAEETLSQARDANFDYLTTLALAEQGNRQSIASLMLFSTNVDAAGGLGHGVAMIELLNIVGDEAFAEVLANQSKEMKQLVASTLDAGIDYSSDAKHNRGLSIQAPLTSKLIADQPMIHK